MAAPQTAMPNGVDAPTVAPKRSFWKRLKLYVRLRLSKSLVTVFLTIKNLPGVRNKSILPTFSKVYPCRPRLSNRIFVPRLWETGDALPPLYIDIHGGGFALGSPWLDDPFCHNFANDNKVLVVSLDYPKAPEQPYPAAIEALTDLIKAVLADETLKFDKAKVAVGGFSAGANLSLAVAQDEDLRKQIGGVVAYYPPTDFSTKAPEKLLSRPANAPPDPLASSVEMFDYGYTNPGQDLTDPLLSVAYTERKKLPPKICLIGCELDLLCNEAEVLAEKLASVGTGERTGSKVLWEQNGVRWEKILGEEHGFDNMITRRENKIRVDKRKKEMYDGAAEWLSREVYV